MSDQDKVPKKGIEDRIIAGEGEASSPKVEAFAGSPAAQTAVEAAQEMGYDTDDEELDYKDIEQWGDLKGAPEAKAAKTEPVVPEVPEVPSKVDEFAGSPAAQTAVEAAQEMGYDTNDEELDYKDIEQWGDLKGASEAKTVKPEPAAPGVPEVPSKVDAFSGEPAAQTAVKAAQEMNYDTDDEELAYKGVSDWGGVVWAIILTAVVCLGIWAAIAIYDENDAYVDEDVYIEDTYFPWYGHDDRGYGAYADAGKDAAPWNKAPSSSASASSKSTR
jgi:hypothetical protein